MGDGLSVQMFVDLVTNSYFKAVFSCPCVHPCSSLTPHFLLHQCSEFLGNKYFVFLHRVLDGDEAEFLRAGLDGQPPGGDGHGLHR